MHSLYLSIDKADNCLDCLCIWKGPPAIIALQCSTPPPSVYEYSTPLISLFRHMCSFLAGPHGLLTNLLNIFILVLTSSPFFNSYLYISSTFLPPHLIPSFLSLFLFTCRSLSLESCSVSLPPVVIPLGIYSVWVFSCTPSSNCVSLSTLFLPPSSTASFPLPAYCTSDSACLTPSSPFTAYLPLFMTSIFCHHMLLYTF